MVEVKGTLFQLKCFMSIEYYLLLFSASCSAIVLYNHIRKAKHFKLTNRIVCILLYVYVFSGVARISSGGWRFSIVQTPSLSLPSLPFSTLSLIHI